MSFITSLKLLHNLLPEGSLGFAFRVLWETGVRSIVFKRGEGAWAMQLLGVRGACDIGTKQIDLDIEMKVEKARDGIFHRHFISIDSKEVPLWVLLHEIGHVVSGPSQEAAEAFAKIKFLEWRLKNESTKR